MSNSVMKGNQTIESEVVNAVVQDTKPIYLTAKIVIAPVNTDSYIPMIVDQLIQINTTVTQLAQEIEGIRNSSSTLDLSVIDAKLDVVVDAFDSIPEWIPANSLQESSGLSADAIRLQLKNPARFEPEVDYKKIGRIWWIHKNAMAKIRRQK